MKKVMKIILVVVMLLNIAILFSNEVFAAWDYTSQLKADWTNNGDNNVMNPVQRTVAVALNVIRTVGTGVAIIMITYVAIKYMSAAPSEKAEFKKSAIAFIVGAIVLFATTNIIGVIEKFARISTSAT